MKLTQYQELLVERNKLVARKRELETELEFQEFVINYLEKIVGPLKPDNFIGNKRFL